MLVKKLVVILFATLITTLPFTAMSDTTRVNSLQEAMEIITKSIGEGNILRARTLKSSELSSAHTIYQFRILTEDGRVITRSVDSRNGVILNKSSEEWVVVRGY